MKNILASFLVLCAASMASGQQLVTEVGRVSTLFDYTNSDGESMDDLFSAHRFSYGLAYRHGLGKRMHARAGMVYNGYAAFGSDAVYDRLYTWDTQYLGLQLGMDMEFLRKGGFALILRGAVEPQWMVKGTQSIGNQVTSLKRVEQFDHAFLFLKGGLAGRFCIDSHVAVTAGYQYGNGIPTGDSGDAEHLSYKTHTISIGLMVSMTYCKYCYTTHFH